MSKKDKLAVYLTPEKKAELERRCHEDGSRSMTAFIEHALDFYLGYLGAQDAGIFLPAAIRSCINGRLGTMENRMAAFLFKQAAARAPHPATCATSARGTAWSWSPMTAPPPNGRSS